MSNYASVLQMQEIVFDKIEFTRRGFKNDNELEFNLDIRIGIKEENNYKATLVLNGNKKDEYEF